MPLAAAAAQEAPLRRLGRLEAPPKTPAEALPVVDFHTHLQRGVTADQLVRHMDAVGVSRMVLMPLYYRDGGGAVNDGEGSDEQARDYARAHPERFVPFVGLQRPELNDPATWRGGGDGPRLIRETEEKLKSGEFFGMGELLARFYPYTNRFGIRATLERDFPVDSWYMQRCAELSARYRRPMVVHAEAEPHVAAAMVRLLEAHPQAIVVWSHNCGRSSAGDIRALMSRFRNLYADLGGMVYSGPGVEHYGIYYPRRTDWMHLVVDDVGRVAADMKAVFEAFSPRFVIGTDIAHARVYAIYDRHLPRWRAFFRQLSPAAAHNIAYRNAERLFRGG
ncbi:MAG: amidohydrolase family protein [Alphaproteobacteria bacterium]